MLGKARDNNLEKGREVKHSLTFSDLAIPIVSLLVLILMVAFVYSPLLTESSTMNTEIEEVKEKQTKLLTLVAAASKIDQSKLITDYQLLTKMVPTRLEVANFAFYVDELAVADGLVLDQITASSSKSQTTQSANAIDDSVYTVSGPLKYHGQYENIVKFLDELQASSPYIITADNINLTKSGSVDGVDTGEWNLELLISGYYMVAQQDMKVDIYSPFAPYTGSSTLLESLRTRGSKL